jgi:transmembrane sensor
MSAELHLEQAIRVWTRRHAGTWTEEDERELSRWLAAAPEHRAAYERVERFWGMAGQLKSPGDDLPVSRSIFTAHRVGVVCAAVVIAALLVPVWYHLDRWWSGVPAHWVAERGVSRTILLQDGTRVLLDADSDIVVKLGAHVRRASLVRGEALFTVTHDVSHPFEIEIGQGRVLDLGTRFDVEKLPDAVRIAVFEGRVGVRTRHGEVVLGAGRSGGYDSRGTLMPVSQTDPAATLRPDGIRQFDSEPLGTVIARLARYHRVTFEFADPRLAHLRVSGTFRVADLSLFLRTLSTALPIEARWIGPQRVEFVSSNNTPDQDPAGRADSGE